METATLVNKIYRCYQDIRVSKARSRTRATLSIQLGYNLALLRDRFFEAKRIILDSKREYTDWGNLFASAKNTKDILIPQLTIGEARRLINGALTWKALSWIFESDLKQMAILENTSTHFIVRAGFQKLLSDARTITCMTTYAFKNWLMTTQNGKEMIKTLKNLWLKHTKTGVFVTNPKTETEAEIDLTSNPTSPTLTPLPPTLPSNISPTKRPREVEVSIETLPTYFPAFKVILENNEEGPTLSIDTRHNVYTPKKMPDGSIQYVQMPYWEYIATIRAQHPFPSTPNGSVSEDDSLSPTVNSDSDVGLGLDESSIDSIDVSEWTNYPYDPYTF